MSSHNQKADTKYLRDIVNYGHHEAIKHWLRITNVKPYSASTDVDFYNLVHRHVAAGNLRLERLRRLTLELNEYGRKRVYLGKLHSFDTIKLEQRFKNHLRSFDLTIDEIPQRKTELPSKPHLDYICWTPQEARIGFCETHEWDKPDRETRSWITVRRTNYITISAHAGNGTIALFMDAPGEKHPHQRTFRGDDVIGYVPYYVAKALEILGAHEFKDLDLLKVSRGIANHPELFRRKRSYDRTAHNSRVTTTSISDVTDDPAYTEGVKIDGRDRIYEGLGGHWLPKGSDKILQREIYMSLSHDEHMIEFPAFNLSDEIEYAISRIRSLSK